MRNKKNKKKSKIKKFVLKIKLVLGLLQLIQNAVVLYYLYRKFSGKHSGNHKNKK